MTTIDSTCTRRPLLPWFYGWNVVGIGVLIVATVLGTVNFSFTFWVTAWMDEFGSSRSTTMLALSAAQICSGLLLPFTGRAMDRYAIRWLASGGIMALSLAFMLISVATEIWHIILIYALFIAGAEALAGPLVAQTLAARWFRARRGMAIGIAAIGTSLGGLLLPPVTVLLMTQFGWRSAHVILAIGMLIVMVPIILAVVRNSPEDKGIEPEPEGPEPSAATALDKPKWTTSLIIRSKVFWLIVLGFLPVMEVTTALSVNFGPYTRDLGVESSHAALLMSLWSGMMVIGKVGFGALADRFDHRALFYAGLVLLGSALLLMMGQPSFMTLVIAIIMLGLSAGGSLPLAGAMIGRHFGALAFGSAMGLFYLCIRPVAFGGPIGGWVRDTFGSYDYFLGFSLLLILALAPCIYWARGKA
jgi:MFS family permease